MKNPNLKRACLLLTALVCFLLSGTRSRAATYPGWNNDVDDRAIPWLGYGGSLFYISFDDVAGAYMLAAWPPAPGQVFDTVIGGFDQEAGINVIAIHDGAIYLAGSGVTSFGNGIQNVTVHGIAKIDLVTGVFSDPVSVTPPMPNIYGIVWDHNGNMYVGGSTTTHGDHYDTNMLVKWTGSGWAPLGGGVRVNDDDHSFIRCMATDGTNIFAGGTFIGFKQSNGTTGSAINILSWNVDSGTYSAMGTPLKGGDTEGSQIVQSMAIGGTNLFVTGTFTNGYSSDASDGGIARFSTVNRAVQPFGTVARGSATKIAAFGSDAYLVGEFDHITNGATVMSVLGVARWANSNGAWSQLGSGINSTAEDVTTNANSVFVYGGFTTAGGLTCSLSARWQLAGDAPLRFTSGSLSASTATLSLAGIQNLDCDVERLDFPSDTWVRMGSITLDGSGAGSFTSSLTNGLGYFRARSRDGSLIYLSTNAFGSIRGTIPSGYWLVGTPFQINVSDMFPEPYDGMLVYYQTNGSLSNVSWSDLFGSWVPSDRGLAQGEGVIVYPASGTNTLTYQTWGLFSPNSFSRPLPTGFSIICSPLYHKYSGGSATQIDQFNSTHLGGNSQVPVNSTSNPKATADRNKTGASNDYIQYTLTTGSQWQTNSVNTTVPILLGEGVWIENRFGSSQTWTVSLPIW